ncbi:MAG: zinc ABC transporter substrate-binding protein [Neisseria sp.]|jgi:zinc/manganese transport system substrate-binding protein|uniref:metal ABC transporter solute-binding protein, Zn/Mn family n=1 Tax=Uruburuella suis TaxID=252130 RepID=UPI001B4548A7|nr:zinc ABC transporter substrate-binding protein [Neisseria sp.]MBP7258464.1 zinc ABC transporter substrate-binding protein [Neisseria sp.]MBP8875812.1 zinc ABC transporter substrate-binding protein [Neisseria sp.]
MKHWKPAVIAALWSGALYAAPMPVVASFSILGDVAQQIGGERVAVQSLVGANQDAHAYNLTSSDIKKIREARLVLLNGLGLEKAELQRAVKQSKVASAEATAGIKPLAADEHHHEHNHGHDHDHGEFDPHVWNDPVLMQRYAANVAIALIKADPAGSRYYQQRFKDYQNVLNQLNNYANQQFGAVAPAKRKVLTGHDSFAYLGKRYQVKFISPQGVSSEAEPSARQIAAIIRQIKAENVKAVFTENIKDGRMIARIAKETGVKVSGGLYADALSSGAPAGTYADMFRYNVRVMSEAMK